MTSYVSNGWYGIGVIESQNGVSKTLRSDTIWRNSPYQFGFYKSNIANCCLKMQTTKSGNWDDPTVWSCNRIPEITDDIYINSSHIIQVPSTNTTIYANKIYYRGGSVQLSNGTILKLKEEY
jgi:hypothetical protein